MWKWAYPPLNQVFLEPKKKERKKERKKEKTLKNASEPGNWSRCVYFKECFATIVYFKWSVLNILM